MTTITENEIVSTLWNNFKYIATSEVQSVLIQGAGGPSTKQVNVQKYLSTLPVETLEDSSDYPVMIIKTPQLRNSNLSFGSNGIKLYSGEVEYTIYATQSEARDKFMQKIMAAVMNNEDNLLSYGVQRLEIGTTDASENAEQRGEINIHWGNVPIQFEVAF